MRLLRVTAVVFFLAAPAARAAEPWSAPQPLGLTNPPSLTANARGLALAVEDAGGASRNGPHTRAAVYGGGAFGAPFTITGQGLAYGPANGQVAAYAQTRLLGAGLHHRSSSRRQAIFSFGRLEPGRASLGEPRKLGPGDLRANAPALAVNTAGDAAMVYSICRDGPCERILVYLAVRRAGSSQIHAVRLTDGSGPFPRVAAAINRRGDALAVWSQASTLYARIRTRGGRLRARQRVGPTARGMQLAPSAALSTHRSEIVGWVQQAVSEGDTSGGTAWVGRARDGTSFNDTRLSDLPRGTGDYVSEAGTRVAFDARGRSLVAYTAYDGTRFVTRAAEVAGAANNPQQSLTDVQTLSDPGVDTVLAGGVVGPRGSELALMVSGVRGHDPTGPGALEAASRAALATGAFTREQITSPAPNGGLPFDVDAAELPDGSVLAAWSGAFSRRASPLP